jgi:hypothetical protein
MAVELPRGCRSRPTAGEPGPSSSNTSRRRERRAQLPARLVSGGPAGNEWLTSATGLILILLLAAIGVTIIRIGQLTWLHLFLGLLLLGPVALKLASTGYRFTRYYTGSRAYREKGPPLLALRLLAPLVIVCTLLVFASGVALLFAGPSSRGTLMPLHKIGFIVWLVFTAVHVLAHLPDASVTLLRPARGGGGTRAALLGGSGGGGRALALAGALVGGVVLAVLLIPDFGPWLHGGGSH